MGAPHVNVEHRHLGRHAAIQWHCW